MDRCQLCDRPIPELRQNGLYLCSPCETYATIVINRTMTKNMDFFINDHTRDDKSNLYNINYVVDGQK